MARRVELTAITNPIVTPQQLLKVQQAYPSPQQRTDAIFDVSLLTQVAGILLRLPQEIIASSIIILQRHLISSDEPASFACLLSGRGKQLDSKVANLSAAAVYLVAKQSFYPLSPRSIVNVYALLSSHFSILIPSFKRYHGITEAATEMIPSPKDFFVSEGTYQTRRDEVFAAEKKLLTAIGFYVKVALPHSLALTYMQALSATSIEVARRVLGHLNAALLSPQLLYLTHQPNALAVAGIYLAAREHDIALVDEEVPWWEVFDVGREELGFLVLSMGSLGPYVMSTVEEGRQA